MTTWGSNIGLTRELFANSMRAAQSIVCLGNVSELPFYSSRADRKHWMKQSPIGNDQLEKTVDGVERNVAGRVCGEVLMQWQTKAAPRAKDGDSELMKPLKRVFCWVIGHNWLSSRYNLLLGVGGNWKCERCGKFAFRLKR